MGERGSIAKWSPACSSHHIGTMPASRQPVSAALLIIGQWGCGNCANHEYAGGILAGENGSAVRSAGRAYRWREAGAHRVSSARGGDAKAADAIFQRSMPAIEGVSQGAEFRFRPAFRL